MLERRFKALLVAALAVMGLLWSIRRLHALGAPYLPFFLTRAIPPAVRAVATNATSAGVFLATQAGTLIVDILQIAVPALALVAFLALLMALRRPRDKRTRDIRVAPRAAATFGVPSPLALTQRCPSCGKPVQDDWVACPACTNRLPVQRLTKTGT